MLVSFIVIWMGIGYACSLSIMETGGLLWIRLPLRGALIALGPTAWLLKLIFRQSVIMDKPEQIVVFKKVNRYENIKKE